MRRGAWPFFGKREAFVPTEQYGYDGASIRLKPDAVPGVPLHINSENEDVV